MRAPWPGVMVPSEQGNGVVQAPAFDRNVRPAGVGSVTTTLFALLGPSLRTSMTKLTVSPFEA